MTGSLEDTIAPVLARWLKPLTADDAANAVADALRAAGVVPAEPATHDTWEKVGWYSPSLADGPNVGSLLDGKFDDNDEPVYRRVVPAEPATHDTPLTRHANELPERLEAAIGTGWVDRDEEPPDFDALLADAAATIRSLAASVVPAEPATHDPADVHGFTDAEHDTLCDLVQRNPDRVAQVLGFFREAAVGGEVPAEPAGHDAQRTAVLRWHQARFPNAEMTNVALKLCEEAAEVGKAINGVVGVNSATGGGDVGEEAADVVIVLWVLLGRWFPDVDLRAAIDAKLARLTDPESDHPAALAAVAAVDGEAPADG